MTVTVDPGTIDVLSAGRGHMTLNVERDGEDKVRQVIKSMLDRGAAIFVELPDGSTRRCKRFDPKRMTYLIDETDVLEALTSSESVAPTRKSGTRKREVPVSESRATAVGRTAGG